MKRAFRTTLFVVTIAVSYWVLFRVRKFIPDRAARWLFDRAHAVFAGWFLDLATSLKGAIIKIGQVLSLRRDLLPRLWVERLSLLQDQVAPSPWTEIAPLLERHLACADELDVDPKALAAASYAQVHRARARDGRELVLKIRHPGLPQMVESDLGRLRLAMALFQRIVPRVDLAEVYEALAASLREELDFAHEGKKLERFRAQFEGEKWSWLRFPEVDWKHTSSEILALEYIPHPTLREAAPREPEKRREVFRRLSEIYYHSVFRHGFFHADPHPGNIMLAPDGSMVLLDFGMMGRVDREAARGLRTFLVGFVDRNVDLLLEGYRQLGILRHPADERLLRALFEDYLEAFREATPMSLHSQLDIAALHERSMQLVWQAKDLRFPFQIVLLLRAEGVIEGLAASLLPESTLVEALSPSLSDYREKGMDLVRAEIDESIAFWRAMPREIRGLFRQVRDGHFQVVTVTPSFDALGHNLFRLVRRVLFALAAFVFCWRATGLSEPRDPWGWASWAVLGWSAFLLFRARYREG